MLLTFGKWRHVSFRGILVSKINGLPFSGGATGDGSGAACPFSGHSCFQNKWFAIFRGCNRGFRPKMDQNGPKLQNYLCACPFFGYSCFDFKCFEQNRTCRIMCVFYNMYACINIRHAICSQKMKIIRLPNLAKCYHFVIILLSSRGLMFGVPIYMNPFSMRHTTVAKLSC